MNNFDDMKLAVEALSGGKNTVIFDDIGMPSIMVILPKMISNALITGAAETVHPAFILDGVEKEKVAISKYHNIIVNSRAYSLPMQDPKASLNWQAAQDACKQKGDGWGSPRFPFGAQSPCGARKTALCHTATTTTARTSLTPMREEQSLTNIQTAEKSMTDAQPQAAARQRGITIIPRSGLPTSTGTCGTGVQA